MLSSGGGFPPPFPLSGELLNQEKRHQDEVEDGSGEVDVAGEPVDLAAALFPLAHGVSPPF